jgi:large subunit ribosomal protein L30e
MVKKKEIPLYEYESTSVNLGYACGKNFAVSSFAVLDEGDTNILHLMKKRK